METGLLDLRDSETVFLVVETGCVYFSEIAFPDVIHVGLRVKHLGGSSVAYEIALFRNDDMIAAAQGKFVHVNVGRDSRRPEPMSNEHRAVLETLNA